MASYSPPSEILSIFNPYVFQSSNSNSDITKSYLQSHYLKYPTTQTGIINIAGTVTNTNSSSNTIFGYGSSILGTNNTGFGYAALQNNTANGVANTAFGYNGLINNTTGDYNAALGGGAGQTNTTGSNNTYLGRAADANAATYSNSTALGSNATITASNQIMMGTASETVTIPNQIAFSYSSNPTLGTTSLGYVYTTTTLITAVLTSGGITLCSITNVAVGVYMAVAVLTFTSVAGSAGISGVFQNGEYYLGGLGNQCLNLSNIYTNSTANATISVNGRVSNGTAGTASSIYFKLIRIA